MYLPRIWLFLSSFLPDVPRLLFSFVLYLETFLQPFFGSRSIGDTLS